MKFKAIHRGSNTGKTTEYRMLLALSFLNKQTKPVKPMAIVKAIHDATGKTLLLETYYSLSAKMVRARLIRHKLAWLKSQVGAGSF